MDDIKYRILKDDELVKVGDCALASLLTDPRPTLEYKPACGTAKHSITGGIYIGGFAGKPCKWVKEHLIAACVMRVEPAKNLHPYHSEPLPLP